MATPYDGKVCLWHWEGEAVSYATIDELAQDVKQQCPVADAIFVKTSDGDSWQGSYDSKAAMRISGPSDVTKWVQALANKGLEFHAWGVLRGLNVNAEADRIIQAAQVPGVKSFILDVEPYDLYWQGSRNDVIALMTRVRNALGNSFHIGLSVDPRSHWFDDIYPDAWRPYVNSVHPQCYWGTMGRSPESILTETYTTWGTYGLPIIPVLQAHAVSQDSIREAQDIARSVRGAVGLSYWRIGVIGAVEYAAIKDEVVGSEIGPDKIWRRYGWQKIIAPGESGYMDGTHTGQAPGDVFSEFGGVRGDQIKYKQTRSDRDTVWALWRPNIPSKGLYEISVFVPGQHATSKQARYHIHGITGVGSELLVRLNQQKYYDQWVPLVVYEFDKKPEGAQVNLSDLTGETGREVAFTAIRWRQVLEQVQPNLRAGFDSPVGTAAERLSDVVWPGTWFDATGYATYYTAVGAAYHTGSDLNNNSPKFDSDKGAPVYAASDGVVTFVGTGSGTWGTLVVIRHDPLPDNTVVWTRCGHVANVIVHQGDRVERGQQICSIGNAGGAVPYHLHFDVAKTNVLESIPGHWPGLDLNAIYQNYADPRQFIRDHRPVSR